MVHCLQGVLHQQPKAGTWKVDGFIKYQSVKRGNASFPSFTLMIFKEYKLIISQRMFFSLSNNLISDSKIRVLIIVLLIKKLVK